jgi:biotin synthase
MKSRAELRDILNMAPGRDLDEVMEQARAAREKQLGRRIFLRGLIEYSNRCRKDCYYCGLRSSNIDLPRYNMGLSEALRTARQGWENGYKAFVIQSGERKDKAFRQEIELLLVRMMDELGPEAEITLSCGEQDLETYQRWREAGAMRYLLRIETSNPDLYYRIHPMDESHRMSERIQALINLKKAGYLLGSGVMIGLPGQDSEDLVDDLLFLKDIGVDMVGMGPYLKHRLTPMADWAELMDDPSKLLLSLKMIAALRLLMPHINIAASTALDAIHPEGRIMAFGAGANVLMPNITSGDYSANYFLYDNKPRISEARELTDRVAAYAAREGYIMEWREQTTC